MIVVDHTGSPAERTDEYFEQWKGGVAVAATCDNIRWKISGLGMADNNWTVDSIRRYVLTSIETFGVERCFFATNWPVDWLWSTYDELVRRLHGDHLRLQPGRADRALLEECRGALPHLTAAAGRPIRLTAIELRSTGPRMTASLLDGRNLPLDPFKHR